MNVRVQHGPARRRAGGFSLLEMLIVVFLILVLTIIMGGGFGAEGRKRTTAACQANLQKIYLALSIYENDNKGALPFFKGADSPSEPLSLLVPKSTTTTEIFICPGSKDDALPEGDPFATRKISYAYYMGRVTNNDAGEIIASDEQVNSAPKTTGQQVFSLNGHAPGNNHGKYGGNLLSGSGEVTASGPMASRDLQFPADVRLLNPQ